MDLGALLKSRGLKAQQPNVVTSPTAVVTIDVGSFVFKRSLVDVECSADLKQLSRCEKIKTCVI